MIERAPGPLARGAATGYQRLRELRFARDDRGGMAAEPDGLPIPPARLRARVVGHGRAGCFLEVGRRHAALIGEMTSRANAPMAEMSAVLDFGCGCGRLVRQWRDIGPEIYGVDFDRALVRWCRRNLPYGTFVRNRLDPPLDLHGRRFDLITAFSVFTHLTAEKERGWMAELERHLKPGGLLFLTSAGIEISRRALAAEETRLFGSGEPVTVIPEGAGTNLCGRYHPPEYVRDRLLRSFEVLEHFDPASEPKRANNLVLYQDAWLARAT